MGIQVSLSDKVEASVELNQNILCVFGLSKGCNSGTTEYINLELSENDKGRWSIDEKDNICPLLKTTTTATTITTAYTTTTTTTMLNLKYWGEIWTKSKHTMCKNIVKRTYLKNGFEY